MQELIDCVTKIKEKNFLEDKSVEYYIKSISKDCGHVPQSMIIEACHIYKMKDLYDKPVVYLKAIINNLYREREEKRRKELNSLGSIPERKIK